MKLDDFLKRDILGFLNALDVNISKDSDAASDDTAFLLSSKEKIDGVDLDSNEFDGISLEIDLFPDESSDSVYIEPSALTSPSEDAPKNIQEQVYASNSSSTQQTQRPVQQTSFQQSQVQQAPTQVIVQQVPNSSSSSDINSLTKTQIKSLVEEELRSKMSQLHSQVPSTKEVVESDHKEAIIRLKNELVDLKTIVNQLQVEKDEVLINQKELSEEIKESKIHENLIEEQLNKKESVIIGSAIPITKSEPQVIIKEVIKEVQVPSKLSSSDVFHVKKSLPENTQSKVSSVSSQPSNSIKEDVPVSNTIINKLENVESSKPSKNIKSKIDLIQIPELVLPKRSKELPEVLFIEEELHKLRLALNNDDSDLAKKLYSSIKKSASKLTQHNDEKKLIYNQLQQASLILSFKLKGRVQSKKPFGKQLVPTKIKPTVLVSSDSSSDESFDSSSMKKYLEALTALKQKEKAKSLELLIQLNDSYPSHLGIKLRLQQALAL